MPSLRLSGPDFAPLLPRLRIVGPRFRAVGPDLFTDPAPPALTSPAIQGIYSSIPYFKPNCLHCIPDEIKNQEQQTHKMDEYVQFVVSGRRRDLTQCSKLKLHLGLGHLKFLELKVYSFSLHRIFVMDFEANLERSNLSQDVLLNSAVCISGTSSSSSESDNSSWSKRTFISSTYTP